MKSDVKQIYHVPVLLNEVINALQVRENKWYIDATAGGGGHSEAILRLGGRVLALDQDEDAVFWLKEKFKSELSSGKIIIKKGNFRKLEKLVAEAKIGEIWGILLDLGMSTYQLKGSGRGFSFREDEKLDMRMAKDEGISAEEVINTFSEDKLYEIFRKFGEEHLARELARATVCARTVKPIRTTSQLREMIIEVYKNAHIKELKDPATRTFQALRIFVNDEAEALKTVLPQALRLVARAGRLVIISFHSLEDRQVKLFFREKAATEAIRLINHKPISAGDDEINRNPSARSARLRVAEKI